MPEMPYLCYLEKTLIAATKKSLTFLEKSDISLQSIFTPAGYYYDLHPRKYIESSTFVK